MWLHTPKTSSSLCLVLDNICCHNHFQQVLYNISNETIYNLSKEKKNYQNMSFQPFLGCYSFNIYKDIYNSNNNNNTQKVLLQSTHNYQTNESNMCIKYNTIIHDPDNNMYYHRYKKELQNIKHEDNESEPIYHEYGNHYNTLQFKMITIIRKPKNRFISSCLDGMHHEGMKDKDYKNMILNLKNIDNNTKKLVYKDRLLNKLQYLTNLTEFYGCQVKMLNGVPCLSKLLVSNGFNQSAIDFAIERLNQYMFIGIFERYEDTVNMLHFYANVSTSPHPIELIKVRSMDIDIENYIYERLYYNDPYDTQLYDAALNIFNKKYEYYKNNSSSNSNSIRDSI